MKKTIIHLVNSNMYSGLENVACDIIKNVKNEYEQIYVTQNGPIVDILNEKEIKYEIIKKMTIGEIRRVVKKYNVNLIHAHDFTASCIAALSLLDVVIISHLHHNAPWLKKINLKTLLYLICSLRFKKIFIVSEAINDEYIFSKIIKNKIECIDNPVAVDKIKKQVTETDFDKKYDICCVGRLTEAKNPIRWLQIIKKIKEEIPNIKCIWVGDGELKNEFESHISKLELDNNVTLLGFQKNPYKYMASSKVYLQTSIWEGYGLTVFEALSLGVPSFVGNVGGLPKIVNDACGSLCDSDDEFISNIIKVLIDEEIYFNKSKNAFLRAESIDTADTYFKKIEKYYRNSIKKGM